MSSAPPVPSAPTPPPPAPPSGKILGLSKAVFAVIVVVILLVAAIAGLLFAGVIPGLKSSGPSGPSGPSYNVTFTETGLPTGTAWSATLGGTTQPSTTTTAVIRATNGTYSWSVSASGYSAAPASGSLTVSGGPTGEGVTFTALPAGQYPVTFTESGLPSGTNWSVTLNGSQMSSTGTTVVFTEPNGIYPFTAGSVAGYTAKPVSGSVTVSGAAAGEGIAYASSGTAGRLSYSQAWTELSSDLSSSEKVVFAGGGSETVAYSNSSAPVLNASCPFTGGTESWPSVPAWTGNYSNGYQTAWIFYVYDSTGPAVHLYFVEGTSVTLVGTVSGKDCVGDFSYENALTATNVTDSTGATAALAGDAAGYVSAYPSASSSLVVFPGFTYLTFTGYPVWYVLYTTCTPTGGGTADNFTAEVNATNGHVLSYSTSTTGTCPDYGLSGSPHLAGPGLGPAMLGVKDAPVALRRAEG